MRELKIISIYCVSLLTLLLLIQYFFVHDLLVDEHLLNWDAVHYFSIKNTGYQGFLVAFFPLFPLVWKVLNLDVYGIVLLNALVYFISFYFLVRTLNLTNLKLVVYLSFPSAIFFFLPYTEAFFFAFATMILLGLKSNKFYLMVLGLFLCSLCRPSFTILLPALILTDFFSNQSFKLKLMRSLFCLLTCLFALILVGVVQFIDTGEWFNFFEVQQGWGNKLQLPHLPFTTWGGNMIVRLDGVTLLVGLSAGIYILFLMLKKRLSDLNSEILLSFFYLAGITLFVLAFRGGSLFSLNRFVFATPFIIYVINYYLDFKFSLNYKQLIIIFLTLILYWLLFGSYVHIQAFLKYTLVSFYLLLFCILKLENRGFHKAFFLLFIGLNFFFQFFFYVYFLMTEGEIGWVG